MFKNTPLILRVANTLRIVFTIDFLAPAGSFNQTNPLIKLHVDPNVECIKIIQLIIGMSTYLWRNDNNLTFEAIFGC